jgi:uncharacterized protein (TIGR03437 family)
MRIFSVMALMASWPLCQAQATWGQQDPKLTTPPGGGLGYAVALSADGSTAALINEGYGLFIFSRSQGFWQYEAGPLQLGLSVAISADGNTVAVGTFSDNSYVGSVSVFTRSGTTWTLQAKLTGSGAAGQSQQGDSVALSADGNTLIAGGDFDNNQAGAVWVFVRSGGQWSQQGAKLTAAARLFGNTLGLSGDGNTAVIGSAIGGWVLGRSGGAWTQRMQLQTGARNVAISSDGLTILLGDSSANTGNGTAWVFANSGGAWTQQGSLSPSGSSPPTRLSLALSGNGSVALIGGPSQNATGTGVASVFLRSNGIWTPQRLTPTDAVNASSQGFSVALSADGKTGLMGGIDDRTVGGAVWVFTYGLPTASTLTVPLNTYGNALMTATVRPLSGGSPTGLVTIEHGLATFYSNFPDAEGTVPVLLAKLAAGSYSGFRAIFHGDANFLSSTTTPDLSFVIQKAPSFINPPILASGIPAFGHAVQLGSYVDVGGSGDPPVGNIVFSEGATVIGSSAMSPSTLASGVASISYTFLTVGTHNITASYGGDANHLPAQQLGSLALKIDPASVSASVTLASGNTAIPWGQQVAFSATLLGVSGYPVGGNVDFVDTASGTKICSGSPVTNGAASCLAYLTSAPGQHVISLQSLANDSRYTLGSIGALTITVTKDQTTTIVSGPATVNEGANAVFTARVTVTPAGAPLTGNVSFTSNGVLVHGCEALLLVGGSAACTITDAPGTYAVVATYSGDNLTISSSGNATFTLVAGGAVTANSASYATSGVASDEIVVIYGANLTNVTATAASPLTMLDDTSVQVIDRAGVSKDALLLYISPTQINCVLPSGIAVGPVTLAIVSPFGTISSNSTVAALSPGLFSANATGKGVAAANVLRVGADGKTVTTNAAAPSPTGPLEAIPIDLGIGGDQVYVVLYGTGIRNNSALPAITVTVNGLDVPVQYAGATPGYLGLDQVNIGPLPPSLRGAGIVPVVFTADGQSANGVTLTIQ